MNNDFHNMDDAFSSAYREFEEQPSWEAWEKINTTLNKRENENYKRGLTGWKRISMLLLILLAGILLYETGILRSTPVISNQKNIVTQVEKHTSSKKDKEQYVSLNQSGSKHDTRTITSANRSPDIFKTGDGKKSTNINKSNSLSEKNSHTATPGLHLYIVNDIVKTKSSNGEAPYAFNEPLSGQTIAPVFKKGNTIIAHMERIIHPINFLYTGQHDLSLKAAKKERLFNPYWSLTGFASYDGVSYKLDSDLPNAINSLRHGEVHEPSFSTGMLATRQVKKHWGLRTGLIFSNIMIGISPQKMFAFHDPAGSIGYKYITSSGYTYIKPGFGAPPVAGDSLTTAEAKHTLQSLSVPVMLKYEISHKRFSLAPGAGIEANFMTSAKLEIEIEDASNKETVFINKLGGSKSFFCSFVADADMQYKVNKNLSLNLRPVFRHALSSITKDNVVETFPYSFGVGFGLSYKF